MLPEYDLQIKAGTLSDDFLWFSQWVLQKNADKM